MNTEVMDALVSAQELLAFFWNNVEDNIDICCTGVHAEALADLMSDCKEKVDLALHGLEINLV